VTAAIAAAVAVFAPMLAEAVVSASHERDLRRAGAVEPDGDVYALMQVAYPGAFVLMLAEGFWRGVEFDRVFWLGVSIFTASKALKYWAIGTLGGRWTFRVLVPRGSTRIVSGPYRWLRHPNYAAVAGELVAVAIMMRALVAGPIVTLLFTALMLARIRVEDRALEVNRR